MIIREVTKIDPVDGIGTEHEWKQKIRHGFWSFSVNEVGWDGHFRRREDKQWWRRWVGCWVAYPSWFGPVLTWESFSYHCFPHSSFYTHSVPSAWNNILAVLVSSTRLQVYNLGKEFHKEEAFLFPLLPTMPMSEFSILCASREPNGIISIVSTITLDCNPTIRYLSSL